MAWLADDCMTEQESFGLPQPYLPQFSSWGAGGSRYSALPWHAPRIL